VHSARHESDVIFRDELHRLHDQHEAFTLRLHLTATAGRLRPTAIGDICPDWRETWGTTRSPTCSARTATSGHP
jgi:stearoyl-CoA 9-desaturase NADPH oxidoreductase